ncbi:MAG: anaerobic ribonucleoside-triphosphate reductase activating protein [candidate division WOR-3 bacterium]|nr:MAG: anaerobic ribonucleoside-triphosphate reductase activating protein [candidate division WOR-3 bacterium]
MIRALIETSLIDWDGKITMVLFCDTCNLNCPYCQNWRLLSDPGAHDIIPWNSIERIIADKETWLDGIVLTGGEPLVCLSETITLCQRIKHLGMLVKCDTNGTLPDALRSLIMQELVDYVAMDIKAPLDERYALAAGMSAPIDTVRESIDLLMTGTVEYEFRTTCVPGIIDTDGIHAIGKAIQGAGKWALQTYVPEHAREETFRAPLPSGYQDMMHRYLVIAQRYVVNSILRGRI